MAPPLDNDAGIIVVKKYVLGPLSGCAAIRVWHGMKFTTIGELRDVTRPIQGAVQYFHGVAMPLVTGCGGAGFVNLFEAVETLQFERFDNVWR